MKSITLTLHGAAARQMIRSMAQSYALLAIKSTLPDDTVNAPWNATGLPRSKWMREVDSERADYRKSLLSIIRELPEFPKVEWRPYRSPTTGKTHSAIYSGPRAIEAARAFGNAFIARAEGK
ncbi:hypothetical protein [Devosia lacusdianchii]|uniref:hypothetical protein n=1 Tax=Devosia lacusdianchii TaxID=2917991 RepID=UPI001F050F46|nr:hypothetical protein [Devosia sp. JXJ CY 41]